MTDISRLKYGPTPDDMYRLLRAQQEAAKSKEPGLVRHTLEEILTRVYQSGIKDGIAFERAHRDFPEAQL